MNFVRLIFKHVSNHFVYDWICCMLLGFGLWVLFVKFGSIWENMSFWWKMKMILDSWWNGEYELVFQFILMSFWCMINVDNVWETFWGQLGLKRGFWGKFSECSREEPKNLGSLFCVTHLASLSPPWRVIHDRTHSFGCSG